MNKLIKSLQKWLTHCKKNGLLMLLLLTTIVLVVITHHHQPEKIYIYEQAWNADNEATADRSSIICYFENHQPVTLLIQKATEVTADPQGPIFKYRYTFFDFDHRSYPAYLDFDPIGGNLSFIMPVKPLEETFNQLFLDYRQTVPASIQKQYPKTQFSGSCEFDKNDTILHGWFSENEVPDKTPLQEIH